MTSPRLVWQASLLDAAADLELDESFSGLTRIQLDPASWVDHAPGWGVGPVSERRSQTGRQEPGPRRPAGEG